MAFNVVTKSARAPTIAVPGSKGNSRPMAQKGGGGNKAAGSVEPTAATAPTVSASPTGQVTTEHFGPSPAQRQRAQAARQAGQQSKRRVQKVRTYVKQRDAETTPKRELHVSKAFLDKAASPKPVTVAAHTRALPGQTKPSVPVAKHQRALPTKQEKDAAVHKALKSANIDWEAPGAQAKALKVELATDKRLGASGVGDEPKLKGTPQERQQARANLQAAKKVVRKAGGSANQITTPVIQTPEQRKILQTVVNTGKKMGASKKELISSIDTGIQETGFKNLKPYENSYGEDTAGWREELAPYYTNRLNVKKSAENYFNEAKTDPSIPGGGGETPGTLAQTVQGSAYGGEETYGTHTAEAQQILKAFYGSGAGASKQAISNLKAAKKEAVALGLKVGGSGVGKAPKQVVTKFHQIKHAATELESKDFPYSWGGGHNSEFAPGGDEENGGPGYDCSGAVSFVLHQAGVLSEPLTSGSMGSVLKPGPGAVTVFYNAEHTFMKIGNEYWGTSVGDSGAGGIGKHPAPSAEYLAQYNVGHVPGLGRKQALQLGFKPGSLTSTGPTSAAAFPGMELSDSGTTATIEQGSGVKKNGKAGFSKKPIELTPLQQIRQNVNKLKRLGTEIAGPGEETKAEQANKPGDSSLHQQLAALEKRYSIGAV